MLHLVVVSPMRRKEKKKKKNINNDLDVFQVITFHGSHVTLVMCYTVTVTCDMIICDHYCDIVTKSCDTFPCSIL